MRSSARGLRTNPPIALHPDNPLGDRKLAHSDIFALGLQRKGELPALARELEIELGAFRAGAEALAALHRWLACLLRAFRRLSISSQNWRSSLDIGPREEPVGDTRG